MHPSTPGSKLYAVVKGALDAGIKVKVSKDKLPSEERIKGDHIVKFAKKIKENKESKQFSKYLKNNIDPEGIPKLFEDVKKKITG
jgi:large subunit ribosomal protein L18